MSQPEYKEITVTMTDGTKFQTRSTLPGKTELRLDIDIKTHPAWIGRGAAGAGRGDKVQKFRDKHRDINFMNLLGGDDNAATEA